MKLLKLTDIVGQVLMLITGLALYYITNDFYTIFPIYYLVGGWQVLSLVVHYLIRPGWLNQKERKHYTKMLIGTAVTGIICYLLLIFEFPAIILFFFLLLIVSPMYAIWYFTIGLSEWQTIKRRELIHLK